jgi:hypothetical protein
VDDIKVLEWAGYITETEERRNACPPKKGLNGKFF